MSAITYDRITIQGGPEFKGLRALEVCIEPNVHGRALLTGIVDDEKTLNDWLFSAENPVVKIYFLDESGQEAREPFFSGYLKDSRCCNESGIAVVTLELLSGTILFDGEKRSRSYQNVQESYEELVRSVVKRTGNGACICSVGENRALQKPLIQYMETDWQFVKRLASHFGTVVYPEVKQPFPRIWFGFPDKQAVKELACEEYVVGISERFYQLGGSFSGYRQSDFVYYQVKTSEDFAIGTSVLFKGKEWRIGWKSAKLVAGEVVFEYTLGQPTLFSVKKQYHSLFSGMSLLGTVLATENETLKLHLDIDERQDQGTAYAYQWTPDTGSVMYCMPKEGTKVSLYFTDEDEQKAKVVSCVRTNGGNTSVSSAGMADPNQRGLTTEHGKKLFLNPESVGLLEEEQGNCLRLEDDVAVTLESCKKIRIETVGTVQFKGKKVVLETPVEMNLVRG